MSSQTEMETGRKAILIVKWQQPWLNCVPLFCGRENLGAMKLGIQQRFVGKVLKVQLVSTSLFIVKCERKGMN